MLCMDELARVDPSCRSETLPDRLAMQLTFQWAHRTRRPLRCIYLDSVVGSCSGISKAAALWPLAW